MKSTKIAYLRAGIVCVAIHLSCAIPTSALAGLLYNFSTFDYPGATETNPFTLNDLGDVAGYYLDGAGVQHGFVYLAGGGFSAIDVPGATQTSLQGITNDRTTAGTYVNSDGGIHGFLRSPGGVFTYYDVPDTTPENPFDTTSTSIGGINNAKDFVGTSNNRAFLHDSTGLHFLTTSVLAATNPYGINSQGIISGNVSSSSFIYENGAFTYYDYPQPGAHDTQAYGINDAGTIVGQYSDSGNRGHGFIKVGNTFSTFDHPDATQSSQALDINNLEWIVGHFDNHGFIARPVPEASTLVLAVLGLLLTSPAVRSHRRA